MDTQLLFRNWGFTRNPFRDPVAELEHNSSSFFVMPPYFSEIVGNPNQLRSSFVFGHRGDGKSTLKVETQKALEAAQPKPIIVEYSSFSDHSEEAAIKSLKLEDHLDKIVGYIINSLLIEVEREPTLLKRLNPAEIGRLQWYLFHFTPGLDWRESERRFSSALNAVPRMEGWKRAGGKGVRSVKSYLMHKRVEFERSPGGSSIVNDVARLIFLLLAPEVPGSGSLKGQPNFNLLQDILNIIVSAGFGGIVVLIDRVDETPLLNDRPDLAARLILPLALAAPVLEMPGVSIKFFLPASILGLLGNKLRTDRVQTFHISWSDGALETVLKKRLEAFSAGSTSSLDPFLEEGVKDDFYRIIFYYSAANPRNMLRLIDSIATELCNIYDTPNRIDGLAIEAGLSKFRSIREGEFDVDEYLRRLKERAEEPPKLSKSG